RSVTVFERNLIAPEDCDLPASRPIELHFPNVAADLHAIGSSIHAESASDGTGNPNETLHAAEVVLGAEGDHAAKVGSGVHVSEVPVEDDVWLRADELQDYPRQLIFTYEQVRASAEKLVGNAVGVEQTQKIRKALVLLDAQQVGGPANAQRSQFGKRGAMLQLHRSEEHTSELQSRFDLVCRLLL